MEFAFWFFLPNSTEEFETQITKSSYLIYRIVKVTVFAFVWFELSFSSFVILYCDLN